MPIPFAPRITIAVGKALPFPERYTRTEVPTDDVIDEYHAQYLTELTGVFERYKASAGYPDATLEVL